MGAAGEGTGQYGSMPDCKGVHSCPLKQSGQLARSALHTQQCVHVPIGTGPAFIPDSSSELSGYVHLYMSVATHCHKP